jgi:hypothetical protein
MVAVAVVLTVKAAVVVAAAAALLHPCHLLFLKLL